jgi:hypothetical protein
MTDTMQSLTAFCEEHGITLQAAHDGEETAPDGWRHDLWTCRLKRKDGHATSSMTVPFKMGQGHKGKPPTLADVLDCLASDSASVEEAENFHDWAHSLGMNLDSIKDREIYQACERQARALKRFLGRELYEELLYATERD